MATRHILGVGKRGFDLLWKDPLVVGGISFMLDPSFI